MNGQQLPPEDQLAAEVAQYHFAQQYPYLAVAAMNLKFVAGPRFAVDTSWRVYCPPGWLAQASRKELELLVWRAIWPLIMGHWKRSQHLPDKEAAALASLVETNEGIQEASYRFENLRPVPANLQMPPGSLLEEIYQYLERQQPPAGSQPAGQPHDQTGSGTSARLGDQSKQPIMAPCSGNCGQPADFELPPELPSEHLEAETAALRHALEKGDLPGKLRERISASARRNLPPWLQALIAALACLGEGQREERGLLNRRLPPNAPVLTPGRTRNNPVVHAILDSSASMDKPKLMRALSLVARLAREADVTLHVGDTQLQSTHRRFQGTSLEVVGRGGTSMAHILEQVRDQKPKLALVMTDGYTDWPSKPLPFPVIAVLLEPDMLTQVPKWIKAHVI